MGSTVSFMVSCCYDSRNTDAESGVPAYNRMAGNPRRGKHCASARTILPSHWSDEDDHSHDTRDGVPDTDVWAFISSVDIRSWFHFNSHFQSTHFAIPGGNRAGSSSFWNDPALLAVRLEYQDVNRVTKVSTLGKIEVWKGRYDGRAVMIRWLGDGHKNMENAVKLAKEAKTMARLSHPKITKFIGVAWSSALRVQIVTEYMDSGDLATWLETPQTKQLTWADGKCQIAIDVAEVVMYLHSFSWPWSHRDIDFHSILVDSVKGVKLSGFSLSRFELPDELDRRAKFWLAPEMRLFKRYSKAVDVYGLGITLFGLDTHSAMPRASFTQKCPLPIQALAVSCVQPSRSARPRMKHVLVELRRIQREMTEEASNFVALDYEDGRGGKWVLLL